MEQKKLNYEITINAGNYQSIRIGGEWSLKEGEEVSVLKILKLDEEMRKQIKAVLDARKSESDKLIESDKKVAGNGSKVANSGDINTTDTTKEKEVVKEVVKKTPLSSDSKILQAILNRMQNGVPLSKVLEFYSPDDKAMLILEAQEKINNKLN